MLYGLTDLISLHWVVINTIIFGVIYQCVVRYWSYFSDRGIKFVRGWPILGSQYEFMTGKKSFSDSFEDVYKTHPDEDIVGMYELGGGPIYLIRDPELIKKVTSKDFEHFVNHRFNISDKSDPLMGRTVFIMKDQKWKEMRSTLSPAFTGNKMRLMLDLIIECAKDYMEHLHKDIGNDAKTYELKDLFQRFASDTIATCAFGIKINSLVDKNNKFFLTGTKITKFEGLNSLKFFAYTGLPKLMNFFKVKLFSAEDSNYLRDMVHSNMKYRADHNVFRPDMINLLMEAQKGTLKHTEEKDEDVGFATVQESDVGKGTQLSKWEDDDITAQCMIFFLAGFNAVSGAQCFMAHELAVNPDIQEKLYQEVSAVSKRLTDQRLTYDELQRMTYLDMVVSETLRRWTLSPASDRCVNKAYVLEDKNGKKVQLNVGDGIFIPTNGIHMDPKYFPNPEKFDPERFSDENKHTIQSGTYNPFGIGPRNCIGSRFALMEMKSLFFYLVKDFVIERCEKTQHPLKLKKMAAIVEAEKGFWIQLRKRN